MVPSISNTIGNAMKSSSLSSSATSGSANLSNMSKPLDSVDIECVYTETIRALRPNFKFLGTYQEACDRVSKMEEEIKESLMKAVPNYEQLMSGTSASGTMASAGAATATATGDLGLGTIREDEEDDRRDENYSGGEAGDEEYGSGGGGGGGDDRELADDDDMMMDDELEYKPRADSMNANSHGSEEEDMQVQQQDETVVNLKKHQEMSKEDEEFIKAFDSLVSENIAVFSIYILLIYYILWTRLLIIIIIFS